MGAPVEVTQRAAKLASRRREDHELATDKACQRVRPHDAHPWGPIVGDSLRYWCRGRVA